MRQTADRLLFELKSRGPQPASTLAAACAITPMGAHKQLQALCAQGLVGFRDEAASGPGRPRRLWMLTGAGHARFPDRHGDLAVQLIRQTAEVLGPAALERLLAAREAQAAAHYEQALAGLKTLAGRLRRLAALRHAEGYMARVEKQAGPVWLLIEDHCPVCAAAAACQGLCRSELALFRRCLGPQARVVREEHLHAGGRRCTYRVTGLPAPGKARLHAAEPLE